MKYTYDARGLRAKYQLHDLARATAARPEGRLVTETFFTHDAAGRLASVGKDSDAPAGCVLSET